MSQSQQKQLHFDLRYTGDFARNFSGGLNKGNLYIGMVEGEFELHSEAVSLWKGGTFFYMLYIRTVNLFQHWLEIYKESIT